MADIRALNLGGWLVLEKWMTPSLFTGTEAPDEYNLLLALGDKREEVLTAHRNTYITEEDFKWISDYGIDTVRLPIGHWLFEEKYPYITAKEYVDKAFMWCEKYNLKMMLDLHAAPGCQNGFDNGGLAGICEWHTKKEYIDTTLDFLEKLAETYKDQQQLAGIELLNEPGWAVPLETLREFYLEGYKRLRNIVGNDVYIVFHDGFRIEQWEEFFQTNNFVNVYLDTHMYQVFSDHDRTRTMTELIYKVSTQRLAELKKVMKFVRVIVGEWSLGLPRKALDMTKNKFTKEALYRAIGNSLIVTFEQTDGWVFWNYKLAEDSTQYNGGWNFRRCVEMSWLPASIKE